MRNIARQVIIVAFSMFCLCSYGQQIKPKEPFEPYTDNAEIEVILKGAPAGKAKLYGVYGNQNVVKDSAIADSSGKVVFKNPKRFLSGLYYTVYSDNSVLTFLLDMNQKIFLHADKMDIINTMKTNSRENEVYYQSQVYESDVAKRQQQITAGLTSNPPGSKEHNDFKEQQQKLIDEKSQVVKGYADKYPGSFFVAFKTMGQNPKLTEPKKANGDLDTAAQVMRYRNEFWNNFDFNDDRILRTPVFFNKLNTYLNNLFMQRVDSIMIGVKFILDKVDKGNKEYFNFTVNYLLLTYKESSVMGSEKIFCYTVDNYFTLKKAYWTDSVNVIRAKQMSNDMKPSLLGEIGQDVRCKNDKGEYVSLYSIKKPIRIVYLWNPDCEHCQKETPKLKALYDKWKSKGLEVYAIDIEHEADKWHKYIEEHNLDWINVSDDKYESLYYKKYHIVNTPGLYVIDSNNRIVAKQLMPDQLEPTFELMLKKYNEH